MIEYEYLPIEQAKKGDIVQCICSNMESYANIRYTYGKIYITDGLDEYNNMCITIKKCDNGFEDDSWYKDNFKLVKTKPGKHAKIGDHVIMADPRDQEQVPLGNISKVIRAEPHTLTIASHPNNFLNANRYKVLCRQTISPPSLLEPTVYSLNTITKEMIKEENMNKNVHYKAFNKGKLNLKGLIYQDAKAELFKDKRPFIKNLIAKEINRVGKVILKQDLKTFKKKAVEKTNLELLGLINLLEKIQERLTDTFEDALTTDDVLVYYRFQQVKNQRTNFKWILDFLTQNNMSKDYVELFHSNKIHIALVNGIMRFENKHWDFELPIYYDQEKESFHF